jgi:hypothetical protein
MPNWLKSKAGTDALNALKYQYAMSEAQFFDTPQENSIPIHLLDDVYEEVTRWGDTYKSYIGQYAYAPGIGYNGYSKFLKSGNGYRRLTTIAKSKLNEHIVDTVYMVAPLRKDIKETRNYMDPRRDARGNYMGQYKHEGRKYNQETGEWEHDPESDAWEMPSVDWAGNKRDKSGYRIPDPEELYSRLYARFPDRLKSRVEEAKAILDEYYDKVNDAKTQVLSKYDIRKGRSPYLGYGDDVYKTPLYKLSEAIKCYGTMYSGFESCMLDDGSIDPQKLARYMKSNDYNSIPYNIKYIDKYLSEIR